MSRVLYSSKRSDQQLLNAFAPTEHHKMHSPVAACRLQHSHDTRTCDIKDTIIPMLSLYIWFKKITYLTDSMNNQFLYLTINI
jgi:hypothetical protein